MTIVQLEYLLAVDTHKSFARAAESCFVTQPTLSMQIKKVEKELNVLIFDRSKKPVLTTDIGRQIIDQARIALQETSRIKELIQHQKNEIKGELRIGIIPTLSPYLLPLFITKFMQQYPDVNLVIEEALSHTIIHKLNNDLIDVGILVTPLNNRSIIEIPLFYEIFKVYFSTSHPLNKKETIDISELNINDMWLLKEGHCFRSQAVNICGENGSVNTNQLKFESGSLETLRRIVEKQHGYTFMPELATLDFNKEQKKYLREFSNPQPVREVSLIIHRGYMKRKLIDLLKQEIVSNIPKELLNKNRGQLVNID